MVQIIRENKGPSFGEQLSQGIGEGLDTLEQYQQMAKKKAEEEKFHTYTEKVLGIKTKGMPIKEASKFAMEAYKQKAKYKNQQQLMKDFGLEEYFGETEPQGKPEAEETPFDWETDELITSKSKQETKPEQTKKQSKKLIPEKKIVLMSLANPAAADKMQKHNDNIMRQERHDETISEQKRNQLRQETLPLRKEIADKATAAREGIQNKAHLLDLIKRGDINDPTYAALATSLPLNLGKRLLSKDTVEYKAGLIEEFGDLKNLFPGQVRVKEIELLEEKIADIYLTDSQKEAILNSRILSLKADIIRAEAAAELENEPLSVLQFEKAVEERAKPKLEALFNQVLDQQKAIIQDAENRKAIPLNPKDPEDLKIMQQILLEAGNDKAKAKTLAKKKNYTW